MNNKSSQIIHACPVSGDIELNNIMVEATAPPLEVTPSVEITITKKKSFITKTQFDCLCTVFVVMASTGLLIGGVLLFYSAKEKGFQMVHHHNSSSRYNDDPKCVGNGCVDRGFGIALMVIGSIPLGCSLCGLMMYCTQETNEFYMKLDD